MKYVLCTRGLANTKHLTNLVSSSSSSPAQTTPQSSHYTKLTTAALAQVPTGPTNLSIYVRSYESHEQVFMGQKVHYGGMPMATELKKWDAYWLAASN